MFFSPRRTSHFINASINASALYKLKLLSWFWSFQWRSRAFFPVNKSLFFASYLIPNLIFRRRSVLVTVVERGAIFGDYYLRLWYSIGVSVFSDWWGKRFSGTQRGYRWLKGAHNNKVLTTKIVQACPIHFLWVHFISFSGLTYHKLIRWRCLGAL